MKNRSSRGDKGGTSGLTLDDFRLWRDFTHDIDSLEDHDWEELEKLIEAQSPRTQIIKGTSLRQAAASQEAQPKKISSQEPQLDARTEQSIRSGKKPIEGKLDLHGYKQDEAHRLTLEFVLKAYSQGKRCLLIITGKGRGSAGGALFDIPEGVLKQKVPQWLSAPPLKEIVLKVFPAHRKHGGDGAVYVYLKRQRP